MYYTHEEDLRLVSSWLNNSTDPIEGNAKKGDCYWKQVAAAYNRTTPSDRKRDVKHLKSHWYKTTKEISFFNGCYCQLSDTYASGRSDDQLMDQALEMYRIRRGQQFTYVHWWKAVRDSPKWKNHISTEGEGTKRASIDQNESTERPQGCKVAKRARGKDKIPACTSDVQEQIETFIQAQSAAKVDMNDMKEFQQRLSAEKVEASRLAYMAAKENKEAKTIENKT